MSTSRSTVAEGKDKSKPPVFAITNILAIIHETFRGTKTKSDLALYEYQRLYKEAQKANNTEGAAEALGHLVAAVLLLEDLPFSAKTNYGSRAIPELVVTNWALVVKKAKKDIDEVTRKRLLLTVKESMDIYEKGGSGGV